MSVDFLSVSASHLWLFNSITQRNDANIHDKYLRLEVGFDMDIFLTLIFHYVHSKGLIVVIQVSLPKNMKNSLLKVLREFVNTPCYRFRALNINSYIRAACAIHVLCVCLEIYPELQLEAKLISKVN